MSTSLHPKSRHNKGYDFSQLSSIHPPLNAFIIKNKFNNQSTIDFSNSDAVLALNYALLKNDYHIEHWSIPKGYLCPPIPGRVDYIHYLADLLEQTIKNKATKSILSQQNIKYDDICVLDIGTGASCIYPILGQRVYQWKFVASDIDEKSIKVANEIIKSNQGLSSMIECRLQTDANHIFNNIIKPNEFYHLTLCNPPFHKSLNEAQQGSNRKWQNLNKNKLANESKNKSNLNFGGQKAELWCKGGELAFIQKMIKESSQYQHQVLWFTCLVSKKDNIRAIKLALKKAKVSEIHIIKMAQGHKISRFIAWTFLLKGSISSS